MNLRAGIIHGIDKIDIMESGSHSELLLFLAIMKRSVPGRCNKTILPQERIFMETMAWELCQLLLECLKKSGANVDGARLSNLSPESWQILLSMARTQRVISLLWHRLRQKGLDGFVPSAAAETFTDAFRENTFHNLRFYGELRRLLSVLNAEKIPLILLKGIFLADAVYGNMGVREMNDIDVLAHPADLVRIAEILADMGYTPLSPISVETTLHSAHHLPRMIKKGHAGFEIHWNLTSPNENFTIDPRGLWERAVPVHIVGCDALTLSPEDLLLHLCLHTSYQHQFAFGLRPSCDIAETIDHFGAGINWQTITNQAMQWGWQRGVYLSLRLANELAGADVPANILVSLRPSDVAEEMLETIRAQVFTDSHFAVSIPVPFAELLECNNIWDKIRMFWPRVFLPKAIIASQYSVPMNSIKIYFCYPRRFVDVLRRHGHTLKKHQQNDASLKILAVRTKKIADWLALQNT